MIKANVVEYKGYSFTKDFPINTALNADGQRRELVPLDEICEGSGGLFLANDWEGLKHEQLSRSYLVGYVYVTNGIHLDGSGNSPKRHSIGTTVSCVSGTENPDLFRKLMDFYGYTTMPPWTDQKGITH